MTKLERFRRRQLSNGSARIMVTMLREAGIAPEKALAEAGIRRGDIDRPDATITGDQELRLERAFVERTRDRPGLWLDIGFRYRLLSYGPFGLAILNAHVLWHRRQVRAHADDLVVDEPADGRQVPLDHEDPRVIELLVRCKGGWPSIEEASEKIGMSARTLRRRLEEKDTTYSALVEGVRRKQAEELLSRTGLSVEQIANSLGYAETASFAHAFKRWTGSSPRQFRTRA